MDNGVLRTLADLAIADAPYEGDMFPPSRYYRFLFRLAAYLQPLVSVELGVSGGGGSYHLAKGCPNADTIGVDVVWDHPDNLNFIFSECRNYHFLMGDSIENAENIFQEYGEIDLMFVDTIHTEERTLMEYEAYRPYLSENAVVCFDDLFRPGMAEAWAKLPSPKLRLDDLHQGSTEGGFGCVYNIK